MGMPIFHSIEGTTAAFTRKTHKGYGYHTP